MSNLKYRLLAIGIMLAAAVWMLVPRTVIERELDPDTGSWQVDTIERVPLKLGLDLRGGVHLALEIDESEGAVADKAEALQRALTVIRNRIDQFGTSEPLIQLVGQERIIVELPGIEDPARAQQIVEQQAFLEFQIVDESQALERVLPRLDALVREQGLGAAGRDTTAAGEPAGGGLQDLFSPTDTTAGVTEQTDTVTAPDALGGAFSGLLQQGSIPGEFYVAIEEVETLRGYLANEAVNAALPPGKVLRWSADSTALGNQWYRALYVLDERAIITGRFIVDARPTTDPIEGVLVQFTLNNEGGRRFRQETGRHIQDFMAIVLDDRVMGRPPVIQSAIGTRGQITMAGQDLQAAQDLALVLRAGSLPAPLAVVEARNIGASLGQDAIDAGLLAGAIAIAFVIVVMVGYYRFSGFLAVIGLVFYTITTLAVLAGFDAVLTLPGLAGFVLSIGMAVDANFLIFERIREELDRGKTVRTAIDEGFSHAWSAIVDTHVTTALTAIILYQFGTGPVQGFAVALLAGLFASLVSAIFVVRTLYMVWLTRTRNPQTLSI